MCIRDRPSDNRCFSDKEYELSGAKISEDLQNWSKAPGDILVVSENSINDNLLNVSAKLTDNLTQNPSRFIRIKVIIE